MGTVYARPEFTQDTGSGKGKLPDLDAALTLTVSLNADRRRIFHVLTIPEYMETWLCVPDRHKERAIQVTSFPTGFHVRYLDEKGISSALAASFQIYRTAKMQLLWSRICGNVASEPSVVKVRLNGDFERTTLCLTHNGLSSHGDRQWHERLWGQSLAKLSSLFELQ
jgi:hypothetical protein